MRAVLTRPTNLEPTPDPCTMTRPPFFALLTGAALLGSTSAPAQTTQPPASCPPGSWFCTGAEPAAPPAPGPALNPSAGLGGKLAPLPNPDLAVTPPPPPSSPPPSVPPGEVPPPAPPPGPYVAVPAFPPPPYPLEYPYRMGPRVTHAWGLDAHVEAAAFGKGTNGSAAMAGGGIGIRFRPRPYFAIEGDLDFLGGTDYQGDRRQETALTINGLVFVNPQSRVQAYLVGGVGFSGAHVDCNAPSLTCPAGTSVDYDYVGAEVGGGVEFRLTGSLALDLDLRGFIRTRTDAWAVVEPEFVDSAGRTTNTSGGGLLTGGLAFFF